MLISYKHRFIFIHVYKVAGSSVYSALTTYADEPGQPFVARLLKSCGITLRRPLTWAFREKDFSDHARACDVCERLTPSAYRQFFSFAFVRNPWDWLVSIYHYMLDNTQHHQHDFVANTFSSFDEFLAWKVVHDLKLQSLFLADAEGRMIVDFVGRIETLDADFAEVCRRGGISAELPHINRSRHADYRAYYNDRTRLLVEEAFRKDIEAFGYGFDELKASRVSISGDT